MARKKSWLKQAKYEVKLALSWLHDAENPEAVEVVHFDDSPTDYLYTEKEAQIHSLQTAILVLETAIYEIQKALHEVSNA